MTISIDNAVMIPEFKISLSMKQKPSELFQVMCATHAAEYVKSIYDADSIDWVESFYCIMLNRSNRVLGFYKVSTGGITGTVADPRVIFQAALLANASSLIISHNHPSGGLKPSKQDEELTHKIKEAGRLLEIRLLDHIIVTSEGHFSFADQGLL